MPADASHAIISLAVALWGAHSAVTKGFQYINKIRDNIICGGDGKRTFDTEHRTLMLYNDWLPLSVGISVVMIMFGVIIWIIPDFTTHRKELRILCVIASLIPFTVGFGNVFFSWQDLRKIKKHIPTSSGSGTILREIG